MKWHKNQKHFIQQEWCMDYPTPPSLSALTIQADTHSCICYPQGEPCLDISSKAESSHFIMHCFTGLFKVPPMPLSHTKQKLILKFLTNFILPPLAEWFCVCRFSVSEKEKAQQQNCAHIHYYFWLSNFITESLHLYTSTI